MRIFILNSLLLLTLCQNVFPASLNDARRDYLNSDYESALKKAKTLNQNDEVLYFLGLVYTKIGNYPQARQYLIELTRKYPHSKFYEQAMLKIADSYFVEGNLTQAKLFYEEVEKKSPSNRYQPLIYLRLAQICAKEGHWQDKDRYIKLLKERYSDSNELIQAAAIDNAKDFFTVQVGAFSGKNNALSLIKELQDKYDVYIFEDRNKNTTLYKVRVGKFKERKDAERIRGRLIKQGYPARIFP
jgi:tetratricopeptide (TPR) repeat protein